MEFINADFNAINFVISAVSSDLRRKHIVTEFSNKSIKFDFFDALMPSEKLHNAITGLCPNLHNSKLSPGEKGCFMSHLSLWKKCIDEGLPYISIFEDDILLSDDAHHFLNQNDWLKERFKVEERFIIKLETFLMAVQCEKQTKIANYAERKFDLLNSAHFGTAGYVISQPAAKYLLDLFQTLPAEALEPIDELIFNKLLNRNDFTVYQLNPALCVQEQQANRENSQLTSQLQNERKRANAKLKPKKTLWQRLIRIKENTYRIFTKRKRKLEAERQEQIRREQSIPFL